MIISTLQVQQWLALKRQQLLLNRALERLNHIPEALLLCRDHDAAAEAMGLELTRTDATTYLYGNDRALARAQQQLEHLKAQVLEQQRRFRRDCIEGRRPMDVDFIPQRRLTVQLRQSADAPGCLPLPVVLDYGSVRSGAAPSGSTDAATGSGVDVPAA